MKYYKLIFPVFIVLLVAGCDYLDYNQAQLHTADDVFQSSSPRSKQFLTAIYGMLPGGFNDVGAAMRASASDDAEENNDYADIQKMNDGRWDAKLTVDGKWGALYSGIRAANLFLTHFDLDALKDRKYNDDYQELLEQYRLYPYQARFLRAFFYFKLIKRYGHVPLITEVLTPDSANKVKPSSYQEVTRFIVAECDAIIPFLPVDYTIIPNKETGRVTRGAAMALKAKTLLYAASPLHNPSADRDKWIAAAKAAKAIIDAGWYTLEPEYSDIFNNLASKELIFGIRQGNANSFERNNFPGGYQGANLNGTNPSQNLVDAYEMQQTGLPINAPGSGYDFEHPYQGRDPRLKATIIVNNSQWKSRKVQIWNNGLDGPPEDQATETGYYLKKYVVEGVSLEPTHTTTARHVWIAFRYGEILLDYAEAMNEAYGPDDPGNLAMTARQAVNKIRERSAMPDFPAGMSKEDFREKLRNERRVEMAFEDQRFWDIRRWKIGPSTTAIYGVEVVKESDDSFTYTSRLVEQRVWNDKMYFYPIPQGEIFKNKDLKQNPGW